MLRGLPVYCASFHTALGFASTNYRSMGIHYTFTRIPAISFPLFPFFSGAAFDRDCLSIDYIRAVHETVQE
jgi:hypothetical protein